MYPLLRTYKYSHTNFQNNATSGPSENHYRTPHICAEQTLAHSSEGFRVLTGFSPVRGLRTQTFLLDPG